MQSSRNIAVVLPNWIGDVVMATPAIQAIREGLCHGDRLTGIMRPYVQEVLSGTELLDNVVLWNKKSKDKRLHFWNVAKELKRRSFDQIILFPNSLSSAALAWLASGRQRIGYRRYWRGPLLTNSLLPPKEKGKYTPISAVDYYLKLTELAGFPTMSRQCVLGTTPADDSKSRRVWHELRLFGKRVIVFNTGGAYGQAKHWIPKYYTELALKLVEDPQNAVLLICGPNEQQTVSKIARDAKHPAVVSMADFPPSIGLSKAVVQQSSLMITTDSGPRHFAAAFSVPTVAMFGSTDPRWAENYNPNEVFLTAGLKCSPCAKRECPLGHHRCMKDLLPQDVYRAAMHLLGNQTAEQQRAAA